MTPVQQIEIKNEYWDGVHMSNGTITIESLEVNDNHEPTKYIELIEDKSNQNENILIGRFALIFNNDEIPFNFGFMIILEGFTARSEIDIPKARMVTIICQICFTLWICSYDK